jgi:hypothetical protein
MTPSLNIPPIPVYLRHCPTMHDMVIPFTTPRHSNGDAALGLTDYTKIAICLRENRCGVCGRRMHDRMVFFMRQRDLRRARSVEPGMCPPCAGYTQRACPMISGRMNHYRQTQSPFVVRRCDNPACLCWAWTSNAEPARYGTSAEPWYALWTTTYQLIHEASGNLVAGFAGSNVLALRPIPHT